MSKRTSAALGLLLLCVTAPPARAATFDGSRELLCAFMDTVECTEEGECIKGDADDVVMPDFVRINFEKQEIKLLDQERRGEATKIQRIEKPEGRVILQGIEGGRGWSLNLSQETGNIVMTVAGDGSGFVVFGECTEP